MPDTYKEVYFGEYCKTCQFEKNREDEDPCEECLIIAAREYSHKPMCWKAKEDA